MNLQQIRMRCIECGDCLLWQGAMMAKDNRPFFRFPGERKQIALRRHICQLLKKDITGKFAVVSCNQPRCVNPEHILLLNKSQFCKKVADDTGFNKNVSRLKKLAEHARKKSKLTINDVNEIRASPLPASEIAKQYGIGKITAWNIQKGKSWKDYTSPFFGLMK